MGFSQLLSTITDVLKSLSNNDSSTSVFPPHSTLGGIDAHQETEQEAPRNAMERQKEATKIPARPLTEELHKRQLVEQERTRQITMLNSHRLPPINRGQHLGPPCFSRVIGFELQFEVASPTAPMRTARTSAFNVAPQHELNALLDEYYRNYQR